MKIAFTVTGPDLAQALATIVRDAQVAPPRRFVRPATASTISPQARRLIARTSEDDDGGES